MKTKQSKPFRSLPKSYGELCRMYLPRPIHDKIDYENTVEVADSFAGFEELMNEDQNDYFDLLCNIIEMHEKENVSPVIRDGRDILNHLAQEQNLNGADISRILGRSSPLGRKILSGERKVTAAHAICLGKYFGVRADLFI